jgi:ribonucleoside-diphosphate reductase beta chain
MSDKKTIINIGQKNATKQPLFFGEDMSLQTYLDFRYENLFDFFKQQLGFYWRPEEVDISKDRGDFKKLTEHEKFIFTKNLGYQTLLDSVQGRGIKNITEHVSNTETEAFCNAWEFVETLHSYSYTYVVKGVYSDANEVFDSIKKDEAIVNRTKSVTKYYDALIEGITEDMENLSDAEKLHALKKQLYLTLVSVNILEGIRFYVSFACSYAFAQNKTMEGNAKIISLINRDENLHLGFSQFVLNRLADTKSEGFQDVVKECEPIVKKMFEDAAQEEMDWADYLFDGFQGDSEENTGMLGLNAEILKRYMKFLTNKRMKALKLEPIFENTKNPIPWINYWTESKAIQEAPQETEKEAYVVASFNNDMNMTDFEGEFNF